MRTPVISSKTPSTTWPVHHGNRPVLYQNLVACINVCAQNWCRHGGPVHKSTPWHEVTA